MRSTSQQMVQRAGRVLLGLMDCLFVARLHVRRFESCADSLAAPQVLLRWFRLTPDERPIGGRGLVAVPDQLHSPPLL